MLQVVGFGLTREFRKNASFSFGGTIGDRFSWTRERFVALYAGVGFADYGSEEADLSCLMGQPPPR